MPDLDALQARMDAVLNATHGHPQAMAYALGTLQELARINRLGGPTQYEAAINRIAAAIEREKERAER